MAQTFEDAFGEKTALRAQEWEEREVARRRALEAALDGTPIDWAASITRATEDEVDEKAVRASYERELDQALGRLPRMPR